MLLNSIQFKQKQLQKNLKTELNFYFKLEFKII
jgi:hypothetical protein